MCDEYHPIPEGDLDHIGIRIENASFEWPQYQSNVCCSLPFWCLEWLHSNGTSTEECKYPSNTVTITSWCCRAWNYKIQIDKYSVGCIWRSTCWHHWKGWWRYSNYLCSYIVGKSSLINAILGELTLLSGSISKKGSISYVSQIPYILNATLKENILFGHPYNEERYLVFVSFAIDSSRNRWRSQP